MHNYEYRFVHDDMKINVRVVYDFSDVSEVQLLANHPYQMRRSWAVYLINKITTGGTATLLPSDVNCLFATRVVDLFQAPVVLSCTKEVDLLTLSLQVVLLYKI